MIAELGLVRVIFAFCGTLVSQNAEMRRKSPRCVIGNAHNACMSDNEVCVIPFTMFFIDQYYNLLRALLTLSILHATKSDRFFIKTTFFKIGID